MPIATHTGAHTAPHPLQGTRGQQLRAYLLEAGLLAEVEGAVTGSFLSCWRKGFLVKESCGPLGGPGTREPDANTPGQYRYSCTLAERLLP